MKNPEDLRLAILGIRKKFNLSQTELSKRLGIYRQTISRYEAKQRNPNMDSTSKILSFIKENSLSIEELIKIGNDYSSEHQKREKIMIDVLILRYRAMAWTSEKKFNGERKILKILNR